MQEKVFMLAYTLPGSKDPPQPKVVAARQLLDEVLVLSKAGAKAIQVWERQCSCEAGFHDPEDDPVVCQWCETGRMVEDRLSVERCGTVYKENEFPF
jgi:hypothetical protein